jgi:hypothetical protein
LPITIDRYAATTVPFFNAIVVTIMNELKMHGSSYSLPRALIYLSIGLPMALVLLAASPLGTNFVYVMAGIPGLLFAWLIVGIWSFAMSVQLAVKRLWLCSLQALILPAVLVGVALNPLRFIHLCNYSGDVVHFVLARPYYDHKIASLPPTNQPRLAVFNWGGMIWASRGLVYDESDEVALPPGHQSAGWLSNPARAELACDGYVVQRLWSHFYLAQFPC